jgi:hypothetical protein
MNLKKIIFPSLFLVWICFNSIYTFTKGPVFFGFIFMIMGFFTLDIMIMFYRFSKNKELWCFPLALISAIFSLSFLIATKELIVPAMSLLFISIVSLTTLFFATNHKLIRKNIFGTFTFSKL